MSACSKDQQNEATTKEPLSNVVTSFGYEIIDTDQSKDYVLLENQDRLFYNPVSFESARIRSLKPLDAYSGPVRGDYYLSIEQYRTPEEAKKRAEEYRDLSRLADETIHNENDLAKKTVRCWGFSSEKRAYLLTTHATMYSALERKVHSVIDGVKSYDKNLVEQVAASDA